MTMIEMQRATGMKRKMIGLLAALMCACPSLAQSAPAENDRWAPAMAAFTEADRVNPPPPGGVLFIGSSSIRLWSTLAEDFPGVRTVNRGFGGSEIADSVRHFDRLVLPHRPRLVVFYAGSNDIHSGRTAEDTAADFREFCARLHAALPETRIIYGSIVLAPARWEKRAEFALANTYLAAFCAADPRRKFVDLNSAMLASDGSPQPELFVADRLHLAPAGYALWRRVFAPLLGQ